MFNSLDEILETIEQNDGQLRTTVSVSIQNVICWSELDVFEEIVEVVFGDFEDDFNNFKVVVNSMIDCDLEDQTVKLDVTITCDIWGAVKKRDNWGNDECLIH